MKKKSDFSIYLEVFLVSTIAGFVCFLAIVFFFARVLSWKLMLNSAIFGPIIGNMIGFANTFIADPIAQRVQSLPKPFSSIGKISSYFAVSVLAAALFFILMVKFGFMTGVSTRLLLTFMLIAGGIGLGVALLLVAYERLKSELEKSYKKLKEKELLEKELQVARQVQAGFLPSGRIQIDGFDVSTFLRSAKEVGGDYFDVIPLKRGVAIVIADVSGKGVPAALVMANLHATLHALVEDCPPEELVGRINNSIFQDTSPELFVTLFYGILDNSTGEFRYINAGHNPPLLVRQDGTVEELTQGGTILGILPDANFQTESITLNSQDLMLLYTDGLTEAGLPEIEPWGEENLKSFLSGIHQNSADRVAELVLKKVEKSLKGTIQTDDIALVLLKRK